MDENTLTATLRSLAAEPVLHTSPSADARLRARQLQRRRGVTALTSVAAIAVVVLAGLHLQTGPKTSSAAATQSWVQQLRDPRNPNHATTGYVGVSRAAGGQWIVYWQDKRLCYALVAVHKAAVSECSSPLSAIKGPLTSTGIGSGAGATIFAVTPSVRAVTAHVLPVPITLKSGQMVTADPAYDTTTVPVGERDFPYSVVIVEGRYVSVQALDKAGRHVGEALAGPDALQVAQVKSVQPCTTFSQPLPASELPDVSGQQCYQLEASAMTVVPTHAESLDDPTRGWLVQVSLNDRDRTTFGELTQRVMSRPAPANQLALVFNGRVQSAPTVQQAIPGGSFQITGGATRFSQQQAQDLAAALAG